MIVPFAVAALAVMLFAAPNVLAQGEAAPAKHTTKVGYLNCHVASRWGFIFGFVAQTAVRLHTDCERQKNRKLRRFDH